MQNYVGKQIDRYRIIKRLGMGGMAVVYKAYDTRLERDVAIKLIRTSEIPESQHQRLFKRFEREAKAQAGFSHRNIIPVFDYGEVDGSPYLVMALVPGGTLKERLNGPIHWQQAVGWLIPIADALAYAHKEGIIHRDVKPGNILFDKNDQPILTDFGIAKVLETNEATLTGIGMGVGTPEYMAPEQWQGKTSPATDQYALGVVLYELITGQKPYTADTPPAVAILQATEPLQAPSLLVQGIPDAVEKMLYKAMARNPQDRYESMASFQKTLQGLLSKENFVIEQETNQEPIALSNPSVSAEAETQDTLGITEDPSSQELQTPSKQKRSPWIGFIVLGLVLLGITIILPRELNRHSTAINTTLVNTQEIETLEPTQQETIETSVIRSTTTPIQVDVISTSIPTEALVQLDTVESFLNDVTVTEFDDCDSIIGWELNGVGRFYQDGIRIDGNNWNGITRKDSFFEHEGFTLDFRYLDSDSEFEILLGSGGWQTSRYLRLGIYGFSGDIESNIYSGKDHIDWSGLSGQIKLSPDTQYTIMMAIGDRGDYLVIVWNPENPDEVFHYFREGNDDWAAHIWKLAIGADSGTIIVDNFIKFEFDGFR